MSKKPEPQATVEKRCIVNFITAVLLLVLSAVLLVMAFGFRRTMRESGSKTESTVTENADGTLTAVIPEGTLSYFTTYGVSFLAAAVSMIYSYKTFKKSKKNKLIIAAYCVFGADLVSFFVGLMMRMNVI